MPWLRTSNQQICQWKQNGMEWNVMDWNGMFVMRRPASHVAARLIDQRPALGIENISIGRVVGRLGGSLDDSPSGLT